MIGINNLKTESLFCPYFEGKDRGHKPRNTGKGMELASSPSLQDRNQTKQMLILVV